MPAEHLQIGRSTLHRTERRHWLQGEAQPRVLFGNQAAARFRAAGVQVAIGGFHVSGCLAMLPDLPPRLPKEVRPIIGAPGVLTAQKPAAIDVLPAEAVAAA